jgi:hypothetical protein
MPEFTGKIVSIKTKPTQKGEALSFMLETKIGNNVWFMCWGDHTSSAFIAQQTTQRVGLHSSFHEGQELTVEADVKETKDQEKKPGKKIAFLEANPKLIKAGPVTADMKAQQQLEYDLGLLDNKRLGQALIQFYADHKDRVEPSDAEFLGSLAAGAAKYKSVSDRQRDFVAKLLAKYAMRIMPWRKIVEASLKGGFNEPRQHAHDPDDGKRSGNAGSHDDF